MTETGADALLAEAAARGARIVFANPGTTELPLVAAVERAATIRPVLGLFEGVCTGAADGYSRVSGEIALTLLHLGPGLSNGLANLHNAQRAVGRVINIVGDYRADLRNAEPGLASDIETLAGGMSRWVRTARAAGEVSRDMAEAAAAVTPVGVATLVVPSDVQADTAPATAAILVPRGPGVTASAVEEAARALAGAGRSAALLLGGRMDAGTLRAAGAVAEATGAHLFGHRSPAFLDRGDGLPTPVPLGRDTAALRRQLGELEVVVLVGAREPVPLFAGPGEPFRSVSPSARVVVLATVDDDVPGAVEALAGAVGGARATEATGTRLELPDLPPAGAAPDARALAATVAALQPEGAIIVDEAISSRAEYYELAAASPRHTLLGIPGGAIGQGLPLATGAALAAPGRRVIAVVGDGSALYTIQALWTQARERLDVTTIICSNRSYAVLRRELARGGFGEPGPRAASLLDLDPALDWPALAGSFGVPATRAETAGELAGALRRSLGTDGPHLIEAVMP